MPSFAEEFARMQSAKHRFWLKVQMTYSCWNWTGAQKGKGYGGFRVGEKTVTAHKFSYENYVGKVPAGMQIDHLCRNRLCVRPSHLEAVTGKENTMRGEGLCAGNARKRTCLRGHELSRTSGNRRTCKTCNRARIKAWREAHREECKTYAREYMRRRRAGV